MSVTVGVRELRENLRAFLDRVKAGEEVVVTERGEAIARIVRSDADAEYQRLIDEGRITPGRRPKGKISLEGLPRLRGRPTLSDIVIAQRRGRDY